MSAAPALCVGQVWYDPATGTRFRIVWITPCPGLPPLVEVRRLNPPFWDDGRYTWSAVSFAGMLREKSTDPDPGYEPPNCYVPGYGWRVI